MDDLFDVIYYIIIFLVIVLPRLLRWLARRGGSAVETQTGAPPVHPGGRTVKIDDDEDELSEIPFPGVIEERVDVTELRKRSQHLIARSNDSMRLCQARGGAAAKLASAVEDGCERPLAALAEELSPRPGEEMLLTESDRQQIERGLDRIEQLLASLEIMIDSRIRPRWAKLLAVLDTAAQECLIPYLDHARRIGLTYPTRLAVAVIGEHTEDLASRLQAGHLAAVVVEEKTADLPRAWVQMVSDISLDVFHSMGGLSRRIASDLGVMPRPLSLSQLTDQSTLVASVVSGWLPRIFADTGAALQLGPGFASGLAAWLGSDEDEQSALTTTIGDPGSSLVVPLYVRMLVACRVLERMGHAEMANKRWVDWNRKLREPATLTIQATDGRSGQLAVEALLSPVSRIVDYLLDEPLAPLGGYPLSAVPGLMCNQRCLAEMQAAVGRLIEVEPIDVPARTILGAAQLAVERSPTTERRIGETALRSIGGEGARELPVSRAAPHPTGFAEMLRSRDFVIQAIVTGAAIAPRTARRRFGRYQGGR